MLDLERQCDICGKVSVYQDEYSSFCKEHKPLNPDRLIAEVKSKPQAKQVYIPPEDDDVLVLLSMARVIERKTGGKNWAVVIRRAAARLQSFIDKGHDIRMYSRLDNDEFAPTPPAVAYVPEPAIQLEYNPQINYINQLNEIHQSLGEPQPVYKYTASGPAHERSFLCEVTISHKISRGCTKLFARASSKKEAKRLTAFEAVRQLRKDQAYERAKLFQHA